MPPKRPRNLRSGGRSTDSWGDVSDKQPSLTDGPAEAGSPAGADGATKTVVDVEDLLAYRKAHLQRQRGVATETLVRGERKGKQAKRQPDGGSAAPHDNGDDKDDDDDDVGNGSGQAKKHTMARSLDGAFTVQTNKLDANKHMMAYIESEMRRRQHGGSDGRGEGEAAGASGPAGADDLYQVPLHLRVVDERPLAEGNVAMAAKMLTSIQEVDLGAGSKARAARATDQALAQRTRRPDDGDGGAPDQQPPSGAWYRRPHDAPSRSSRASDDAALQRFKKRMRR
ncbi:hypothetical protein IWQ56_003358 [Coemansia nantahalensis]|nr:hypothetical protein IWQ56_003358 [Coemansia nantahalensis]